jgi:glycosyltransferase involved in cell wall biosynthesis
MRFFYLCYENLQEHRGGTRHVTEVVRQLALLGHEVELFVPAPPPAGVFDRGVRIHVVPVPPIRIAAWVVFYVFSALAMGMSGLRRRPDVLYVREMAYNLCPFAAARLLGCPLIVEVNGSLMDEMRLFGAGAVEIGLTRVTQWLTFQEADRIVAVAEGLGEQMAALYDVPREKIAVIPNGTDPDRMRPADLAESQRAIGLTPGPVVGFVGSCYPYHDIDMLIRAAPAILNACPDTRFVVAGDGYMRSAWMARAREEGLGRHFLFPGRIPYDRVPTYIAAFTVCIALFTHQSKGSPMKLYDYMACGRPAVATDQKGTGDVVRAHRAGLTVAPGDVQALAGAVVRLLNDPSLCAEMGRNGRQAAERYFTWRRAAADIVRVVDGIKT